MKKKNSTVKSLKGAKSNKRPKSNKRGAVKIVHHANGHPFTGARPGVLATIVEMLRNTSKTRPITKLQILEECCKRFRDREREHMKATIAMQVPSGLRIEKSIIVNVLDTENGKSYYI